MRDEAVPLDDPCADGQVKTVMKSRGYRKVAGDVCIKGVAGLEFEAYEFTCCSGNSSNSNPTPSPAANVITNDNKPLVAGLGVALAVFIVISIVLGLVAAIFVWLVLILISMVLEEIHTSTSITTRLQ